MTTPSEVPTWHIRGQVILACNCDFGCPCNFNGLPTTGKCEGAWNWHIQEGSYGDVRLDGLTFCVAVNWPGAIHEGGGEAFFVFDERAGGADVDQPDGEIAEPAVDRLGQRQALIDAALVGHEIARGVISRR